LTSSTAGPNAISKRSPTVTPPVFQFGDRLREVGDAVDQNGSIAFQMLGEQQRRRLRAQTDHRHPGFEGLERLCSDVPALDRNHTGVRAPRATDLTGQLARAFRPELRRAYENHEPGVSDSDRRTLRARLAVDVSPATIELASRRRPVANIDDRIADLVDNRPGSGRVHAARRALARRLRALTLRQRRDALELYR
jgi:hypothetical protein